MDTKIHVHDVVVLTENTPAEHFETRFPLLLRRGQLGTVVLDYDGNNFEVEFASKDGVTFSLVALPATKLIVLQEEPEYSTAT